MGRRQQDGLSLVTIHLHLLAIYEEAILLQSLYLYSSLGTVGVRYGEGSQMECILLCIISQKLRSSHFLAIIQ